MEETNKINSKISKLKSSIILVIYIAFMIIIALLFHKYVDQESLQETVKNTGNLGILFYSFIEIIYVTFTPLLNTFILIASGYIFGGNIGFIVNFISTTIGLFLIVFLVKLYGRNLLLKVISPKFYQRFDEIVQKVGPITLSVVYVLPFTPDDELTYIMAAGPVSFKRFILPIVLGTIAKSAYSYIGALGLKGTLIALYFRASMLVVGIILISIQEYFLKKT